MTVPTDLTRDIALEVAYNVRHLGGYSARDGHQTSNQLIRAGSLHRLTEAGIDRLRELEVQAVVDLRSPQEQAQEPTPDLAPAGIRMVSAPVFSDGSDGRTPARFESEWTTTYQRVLELGMPAFRTLFEIIASCNGAVFFHCTAGKDRTGMAAMLLLDLAGVDHAQIVADYSRSAGLLEPEFKRWEVEWKERGLPPQRIAQLLSSDAEAVTTTLSYIGERWGSSEGYLAEIGVSEAARSGVLARVCS